MQNIETKVSGNIVDVLNSKIYPGTLIISNGKIKEVVREKNNYNTYIIPGFVDSHVHIESSMMTPSEFARAASIHGTVATVSDPHEIANVMGIDGVKYMIEDAKSVPVKLYFGAPSCVPATIFETAGAELGPESVESLLKLNEIKCLGEMMNFPGVLCGDPGVMQKIQAAKRHSKPVDGHAPGLRGDDLVRYSNAGISTNHESLTLDEALEDIRAGMKVQIREGSAAKSLDEIVTLLENYYDCCMFCSDDKHPHDLVKGHINDMVKKAVSLGINVMNVLRAACVNPVMHYGLDVGLLREGDDADFLEVDSLDNFNILKTYINGEMLASEGKTLIPRCPSKIINNFHTFAKNVTDFGVLYGNGKINVIKVIDEQLQTERLVTEPKVEYSHVVSDVSRDILKITVVNRYKDVKPALGFIKNFGLRKGAIASSVAHDSHNIVSVGIRDEDICRAVNLIIEAKGGICIVSDGQEMILPLPIAGIMSDAEYAAVAEKYMLLDRNVKSMGSQLHAPFMTLSFMALLVIPKIKLSDKGLFDSDKFEYMNIFEASC